MSFFFFLAEDRTCKAAHSEIKLLWTVMCRATMDIKKVHLKSDCLRGIVTSRFGLRLLRDSAHQDEALGRWRGTVVKSAIRKYIHREKKRSRMAKLAQNSNETQRTREFHVFREEASFHLPPPGAMAPANTTQYLMGQFYEDLQQQKDQVLSFPTFLQQSEGLVSPQNIDTTSDSYEACLSFLQRDFEEQFGSLW